MNCAKQVATFVTIAFLATAAYGADDDAKAREQFGDILAGINQRSFSTVKNGLSQRDLINRIYGVRPIAPDVKQIFEGNFWEVAESAFMQHLPESQTQLNGELIHFEFQGGDGTAAVRFDLPKYSYAYQVFELRRSGGGRFRIVDWFDSSTGHSYAEEISEQLLTIKPTKAETQRLLTLPSPTDLQLFQATEILKAVRDNQPRRFFEIYDEFDEQLTREPLIAKFAVRMAYGLQDVDRFLTALDIFADVYSARPNYALYLSDLYLVVEEYEKSYEQLRKFQENFAIKEGALPAKLSALALATGRSGDAEKFAVAATTNEPTLELGWWSLLRARAAAGDFAGAIEPLTQLEDVFGHHLDAAQLKRDRFRAFGELAGSQEFRDWRDTRN